MDAIVIESVRKVFRDWPALLPWRLDKSEIPALVDFSLRIPSGTVQVLLGPNGSGKTTLLKLISTMLLPDAGRVLIHGWVTSQKGDFVRRMVGFAIASERSFFPRLTARENLEFFATLEDVPRRERACRIRGVLDTTGLNDHANNMAMTFSSGMYQRLGIARALLKNPSILLLDEPSRSLDPGSATHLWRLIRELSCAGCTIVVATHNFHEAVAIGDNVAMLCQGRLTGRYRIEGPQSPERLRGFYFDCIGKKDDDFEFALPYEENRAFAG